MHAARRLRELMLRPGPVIAPGVYDCVSARVVAMDNPDAGMQTAQAAWVPDSPGATYVDPALTGLVTRLAGSASGAQAGVMLRAGNAHPPRHVADHQQSNNNRQIKLGDRQWQTCWQ